MAGRMIESDNYNRIFIIGPKECNQDEVRGLFDKFGEIQDVYIPRDKATGQSKGVVYVTYKKASEAALAIEDMNGKGFFKNSSRPLKVVLASSKVQGSVRDRNEDEKMMRLFIVVPHSYKEDDIREEFKKYGDVEYVRMVKERQTGESRGLAYVKFTRAYDAAVALETCPSTFKAVFAETSKPRGSERNVMSDYKSQPRPTYSSQTYNSSLSAPAPAMYLDYQSHQYEPQRPQSHLSGPDVLRNYPHSGQTVIEADFPTYVTYEQVNRLFDLIPGLDCCNYDHATGKAYVKYSSPQAAAYARDKMDVLEYPPGYRITVQYIKDNSSSYSSALNTTTDAFGNVHSLVESIQKATVLLQQAGLGMHSGPGSSGYTTGGYGGGGGGYNGGGYSRSRYDSDNKYCNVSLPDKKPFASRDSPVAQRLFLVSQPDTFDDRILEDCFCRFGDMIGAYFMPGKKFGYVKYASTEAASQAMSALHGKVICGNTLKVLPAEPPRKRTDESSKRDRSSDRNWSEGRSRSAHQRSDDESSPPREKHSRFS